MPRIVDYGSECSIQGCLKAPYPGNAGMCSRHYEQMRRLKKGLPVGIKSTWSVDIKPGAAHNRCRMLWGKADQYPCIECRKQAKDWAYDGTDPTQLYAQGSDGTWTWLSRFPEFYMPMCRKCHRVRDGGNTRRELHKYRLASFIPPEQEFDVLVVGKIPQEESYAQAVRTATRSRSSRGERVIHVGRGPSDGRPRSRKPGCRSRTA